MKLVKNVQNQKGFTLVELIVVIAILGILAAIAVPRFSDQTTKANTAKLASDLNAIDTAITLGIADGNINSATTSGNITSTGTPSSTVNILVYYNYLSVWPTPPKGSAYYQGGAAAVTIDPASITYTVDGTAPNFRGMFNAGTGRATTHAEDWHK